MSKELIVKMIELIDEQLRDNRETDNVNAPTTKLLMDLRNWWIDVLSRKYEVFYE